MDRDGNVVGANVAGNANNAPAPGPAAGPGNANVAAPAPVQVQAVHFPHFNPKIPRKFGGDEGKGEDAEVFFLEWEDYCDSMGWVPGMNPDNRLNKFKNVLTSEARKWLNTVNPQNFQELSQQFRDRFSKLPTRDEDLRFLTGVKKSESESYDSYGSKISAAANRIGMGGQALMFFTNGLKPQLKLYISTFQPQTIDQAIVNCKTFDSLNSESANLNVTPEVHFSLQLEQRIDSLGEKLESLMLAKDVEKKQPRVQTPHRGNSRSRSLDGGREAIREKSRERYRDNSRQRTGLRERYRGRSREKFRERSRDTYRNRSKPREQSRSRQKSRGDSRESDRSRYKSETKPSNDSGCYACGELGHWAHKCPYIEQLKLMQRDKQNQLNN